MQVITSFTIVAITVPCLHAQDAEQVLARVGSSPITLGDVCFQLGIDIDKGAKQLAPVLRDGTVHLIGLQRQALQTLRQQKHAAAPADIDAWLAERTLQSGSPLMSLTALRDLADFRLSWKAYLDKQLSQKNLERHFANQKKRFDGSHFDIQLISLQVPPGSSEIRQGKLQELKSKLIDVDESQFAEQAAAIAGAEYIHDNVRGTGDVDPAIITQVLKLIPGQTSPPFSTGAAVHVVRLIAEQPGELELSDVTDEVRAHMLLFLLEYLASQSDQEMPLVAESN